ncbi:hypothetical protein [Pseudotabrizicola algicola]|uniref:Uncharacterized protein n=1 Tax=Pseudotabrizicola algicola TaxID=2709381 RepID=A0A6B3RGW0_9RHOB|nr:hypothetical protein [Pseudotabrizicola algicola]NEX45200.1 hypothetical protein [Pseudotabrizicola algicola]
MTAALSPDRQTVTLRGPSWSRVFPAAQIAAQLRFYRGLSERGGKGKGHPGPHARHYAPTIAALDAVAREVGA